METASGVRTGSVNEPGGPESWGEWLRLDMTCNGELWGIWSKGGAGFKGRKGLLVTGWAGLEREGRKPQGGAVR